MRVSYCYAVRDQNRLVYQADDEFVASLPKELRDPMKRWFERFKPVSTTRWACSRPCTPGTTTSAG